METIIKKAIEGGYGEEHRKMWADVSECSKDCPAYVSFERHMQTALSKKPIEKLVLDPLFWQALGRACGWEGGKSECHNYEVSRYPKETEGPKGIFLPVWYDWCKVCLEKCKLKKGEKPKDVALRFHEINLTEGFDKAVKYLEDLVK